MLLLSVRHTGTRFVTAFLKHLGVAHAQIHSAPSETARIKEAAPHGIIIPMRDPLLSWVSHYNEVKRQAIVPIVDEVLLQWGLLRYYEDNYPHVHLRLDAEDQDSELQAVADYCESEVLVEGFKWEPVGVWSNVPTDYSYWDQLLEERPALAEQVVKRLQAIREHYGYRHAIERAA